MRTTVLWSLLTTAWLVLWSPGIDIHAQIPDWLTARGAAGTSSSVGTGVALDRAGNATVTGHFRGSISLSQFPLTAVGAADDIWVSHYNAAGQLQWQLRAGGRGPDGGTAVATDSAGYLYVAGYFQDTLAWGGYQAVSRGGTDLFVARLSTDGTLQWLRTGGGPADDYATGVTVDEHGRVFLSGQFQQTLTLTASSISTPGASAAFLALLDAQGNLGWLRSLGLGQATGVAASAGLVCVSGALTTLAPGSAGAVFLAGFDINGSLLGFRSGAETLGTAVAAGAGRVTVVGRFAGTLPASTATLVSAGSYDGFVLQYDNAGTEQWAARLGGPEEDQVRSVAIGPDGAVWSTGYYRGTATLGASTLQSGAACVGAFVTNYSPAGQLQWTRTVQGTVSSSGGGIAAGAAGAWLTGGYQGTATFGGLPPLTSRCATELFVATLGTTFPDLVVNTAQAVTGSYRNVTVTGTGAATLTGSLQVTGALTVQSGGLLDTRCQPLTGPGSFQLAAGAELRICAPDGISASGNTGAIRVSGPRTYSSGARYVYNGTAPQQSGNGLPGSTQELVVDNAAGLALTTGTTITQLLRLRAGNLTVNGQMLTLASSAAGTALVDNRGGQVSGSVTVQRYIEPGQNPGFGYRHLASPVQGAPISDLGTSTFTPVVNTAYNTSTTPGTVQPYPTIFGYDETRLGSSPATTLDAFSKGWVSPPALTSVLEPLQGYSVNLAAQTVDFVGPLTSGLVSRTLGRGPQADAGWHLVGNPYPAPIDWRRVSLPAGLDAAVYVYRSSGPYAGQYRSYLNGVGDPLLPLGQGFLVRVGAPSSSVTFTLTDAVRLTDFAPTPAFYRAAPDTRPLVQLTLEDGQGVGIDEATVYFEPGATATFEPRYDALKVPPTAAARGELATSTQEGHSAAINGLPLPGPEVVVPLHLRVRQAGAYVLRGPLLQNLPGAQLELLDAETGAVVDLRRTAGLPVQLAADTPYDHRFVLRIRTGRAAVPVSRAAR